jgi:hypothetical protein
MKRGEQMKRGFLLITVIGILLLGACATSTPSLASTPVDVAETIEVGMNLGEVYDLIDPNYGENACYVVNCESITSSPTINFTPTMELMTDYFIWFFMPQSGKTQATAVCFRYDSSIDTNIVIAVGQLDYDEVESIIQSYGTKTMW